MTFFVKSGQTLVFAVQKVLHFVSYAIFFFRSTTSDNNVVDPKMNALAFLCNQPSCNICSRHTRTAECALEKCTYRLCNRCVFLYYQTSPRKICPACRRPEAFVVANQCWCKDRYNCGVNTCMVIRPYIIVAGQGCCCAFSAVVIVLIASAIGNIISCIVGSSCFESNFFGHGILVFVLTVGCIIFIIGIFSSSSDND